VFPLVDDALLTAVRRNAADCSGANFSFPSRGVATPQYCRGGMELFRKLAIDSTRGGPVQRLSCSESRTV
jgi:hypothetical protein